VFVGLITPRFIHPQNLSNVTLQVALVAIVAIGATLVILTGGIDLSPGATVALVCCSLAHLVRKMGVPLPIGIILMLFMGVGLGFINGFLSSYGKIPSFIVTLATMNIYRGLAFAITGGITIFSVSPQLEPIFYGRFLGIPHPFYYVVILYGAAAVFLRYTVPGRSIYAIGGNEAAARLSGINVNRIRLLAFVIAGLTASIAGILETAWLDSGSAAYGSELALGGIAAAVIGGASLVGGYANILSSLVGALTVAVVQNGLNLHAVQLAWQDVTLGLVIILAVGVDMWRGSISTSLGRLFRRSPEGASD
jgi:ribose transport system permease protein